MGRGKGKDDWMFDTVLVLWIPKEKDLTGRIELETIKLEGVKGICMDTRLSLPKLIDILVDPTKILFPFGSG